MIKNYKLFSFYSLIVLLLILLDQLVKWWIIANHPSLVLANTGIIFGFIQNPIISYILLVIGVVFLVWMVRRQPSANSYQLTVFILIIAGAISNLIDRVFRGYVIDYIHFFNLNVFNLADVFIITGIVLYAYQILKIKES